MTGYQWAYDHTDLNATITVMQRAFLSRTTVGMPDFMNSLTKAGWLASLLANSRVTAHRQKALLFAALAKLVQPDAASVEALCYTIFARTGTLPAAMHLQKIVDARQVYAGPPLGALSDEFVAAYENAFSELAGGIVLTEFQHDTATSLNQGSSGILSAPTSAGKSFVVHEHVKARLAMPSQFVALFIVPTKALIAQVCSLYRQYKRSNGLDFRIYSSVSDSMQVPSSSAVLALTQERCIRLLGTPLVQALTFVFADEIQSLEDGDRGTILEYVLHEVKGAAPQAKLFAAGPFLANGRALGQSLFSQNCDLIETDESPVSQMVVQLTPVKNTHNIQIKIIDPKASEGDVTFELDAGQSLYSRWKGSQTKAIADAVNTFAGSSPSIVYAPGQVTAQNWAKEYVQLAEVSGAVTDETKELIAYIKDSIHPQCSLIECLSSRVAYHHGGLPDFVREEIEGLFADRAIDVLFCTSTLLEGVNLPADKIFVVSAKKADEALSGFEFKNLIGRAGRLDEHLCGVVYCVQVPDDEKGDWIDAFRGDAQKEVMPTVDRRLASSFEEIRDILQYGKPLYPENDDAKVRGTVTILRSRFLRGREHAQRYLENKQITDEQRRALLDAMVEPTARLTVPPSLALRNPYVDPVLQDELYKQVVANPATWSIRRAIGFAIDLERVFKQLNSVFHIIQEINPFGHPDYYRNDLLTFAKLWLRGKPFREIVTRALPKAYRQARVVPSAEVDKAIKRAMGFITRDISFVTAKYFSVLAEVLSVVVPEEEREPYGMTLVLPVMLELGCSDPKSLALVTACIPRGAALKIGPLIPDDVEDPVVWLTLHQNDQRFSRLPPIYHKILRRCGIWQ